jgi:hypothetical protein
MNKKVAPEHDNQVDSYVDLTEEVHNHHFIITRSFFCLSVDITLYAFYTGYNSRLQRQQNDGIA